MLFGITNSAYGQKSRQECLKAASMSAYTATSSEKRVANMKVGPTQNSTVSQVEFLTRGGGGETLRGRRLALEERKLQATTQSVQRKRQKMNDKIAKLQRSTLHPCSTIQLRGIQQNRSPNKHQNLASVLSCGWPVLMPYPVYLNKSTQSTQVHTGSLASTQAL